MKTFIGFRALALLAILAAGVFCAVPRAPSCPPLLPLVTITASDPNASEVGPETGTFTVTRTGGNQSLPLTVYYSRGGTAVNGTDYQTLSVWVQIAAGTNAAYVTVTPKLDLDSDEGNETVVLTLTDTAYYDLGSPSSATVTIADVPDDSDSDGLPDAWEWWHFGNLDEEMYGDYDGDDSYNIEEYDEGTDPNTIKFSTEFVTDHVNSNSVSGTIEVLTGVPSQMAFVVNSTDFASSAWVAYSANFTANLGTSNGNYDVWIGLRGRAATSEQTWDWARITRDIVAPVTVITNPPSSTTSRPIIQLQGYSLEPLASLWFDVTNAAGGLTNEQGFVSSQYLDHSQFQFTTNWFQCFDIELTNGDNGIILRATDWAGNTSTNVYVYTFSTNGDSTAPVLTLYWPQDGAQLCGDSFTVRGWLDDPTASVSAQITGQDGATNAMQKAVVERNGLFWVEELPLTEGTNTLILTATDAAGNAASTNINVIKSTVELTITELQDSELDQLHQPPISVSGTINVTDHRLWVNGVEVTNIAGGSWSVEGVPLPAGGTAVIQARAIPNSETPSGGSGGNAFTYANPGNPTAPNLKDKEYDPEQAPYLYVEYYTNAWQQTYVPVVLTNWAMFLTNFHTQHWTNGHRSASKHVVFGHYSGLGDITDTTDYGWPGSWWPTLVDGTNHYVCVIEGEVVIDDTGPCDPPVIGLEHCAVSDKSRYPAATRLAEDDYWRTAHKTMKLFTGGKAKVQRRNLFTISASAWKVRNKRWRPDTSWEQANATAIASERIAMGQLGNLASDGVLYTVLSDNETNDITPRINGPRFYTFEVPAFGKISPRLNQLTFGATNNMLQAILQDTGTQGEYPTPHWETNETAHTVQSSPALFVSGARVMATNVFAMAVRGSVPAVNLVAIGVGASAGFGLQGWSVYSGGATWEVTTTAITPIPASKVDAFEPMRIRWYVRFAGTGAYADAGENTNHVYVTLRAPTTANLYHTVAHLACAHPGAVNDDQAVANTWSFFPGLKVKTWDGIPLTYYGVARPGSDTTASLLSKQDGTCDAWGNLLGDAFLANGVPNIYLWYVNPATNHDRLAVKNIDFADPPDYLSLAPYVYSYDNLYLYPTNLPGQNKNPPSEKRFAYHAIVRRGTSGIEYYDPAYGTAPTGPADYVPRIDAWGIYEGLFWRAAAGSGLLPVFSNTKPTP